MINDHTPPPSSPNTHTHFNFDDLLLTSLFFPLSRYRFYGGPIKTVSAAPHGSFQTHAPSSVSCVPSALRSHVWEQTHFLNEILIMTLYQCPFSFHGNRKLTMPTEVEYEATNEGKHPKMCTIFTTAVQCRWLRGQMMLLLQLFMLYPNKAEKKQRLVGFFYSSKWLLHLLMTGGEFTLLLGASIRQICSV